MIGLIQNKTIYEYDIRSLILAFMLGEKIELTDHVDSIYDFILDVDYKDQEIVMNLYKKGELEDEIQLFGDYENKKIFKNRMKQGIYQLFSKALDKQLPWGTLTGIRPTKIAFDGYEKGESSEEIIHRFQKDYLASEENGHRPLIIIGKTNTPHGKELVARYGMESSIRFIGGIYDFKKLNSIRRFSFAYFHGHSVGGTNPSLLEAMASGCFILANDNLFNRAVLKHNAEYYTTSAEVTDLLNNMDLLAMRDKKRFIKANLEEIRTEYSWEHLVDEHEKYFEWLLAQKS